MGVNGNVKLTNVSVETEVHIQLKGQDWRNDIGKYVHLSPRLLLKRGENREDWKYRARDDMYSVGMIMWEIWTGEQPKPCEEHLHTTEISDTGNDLELLGSYLECLQLPMSFHFENDDITTKIWCEKMRRCLNVDEKMTATDWFETKEKQLVECVQTEENALENI